MSSKKNPADLRSARWFAPDDLRAFGHRSRAMQMGYAPEEWKGRPVIAILDADQHQRPCRHRAERRPDGAIERRAVDARFDPGGCERH